MSNLDLGGLLEEVLPKDVGITVRHVSTTPTQCEAIFSAPPGEDPETTFGESHFLAVSIRGDGKEGGEVLVFGMEVLVYSTDRLTTLFVSKADSTGYLHLLKAPPKLSLLRAISTTFLSYLVKARQRPGIRLVLSLFARAQNQYLFPGSIDNAGKHVLDDRGLIKWWCRVFDPILREYERESSSKDKALLDQTVESAKSSATAYLIVPGCDKFETRTFFPPTAKADDKDRPRWLNSYPLHQICKNPEAPPRCLVPRFPDDPKARFLTDLDDELPGSTTAEASSKNAGQWRSVKTLNQFWEMMSFRQECSSGRLVGFLWLVVNPPGLVNSDNMANQKPRSTENDALSSVRPTEEARRTDEVPSRRSANSSGPHDSSTGDVDDPILGRWKQDEKTPLATQPPGSSSEGSASVQGPSDSHPFHWPEAGRGHVVLSDNDYKSANDCLIEQDFETEELAIAGTRAWIYKVSSLVDQLWWGQLVVGKKSITEDTTNRSEIANVMDTGLFRKRKKEEKDDSQITGTESGAANQPSTDEAPKELSSEPFPGVNVLNANFIRKKKKT